MRVLVTGSAGFVGRYLVDELASHGHDPVGLDTAPADRTPDDIPYHQGDITDPDSLRAGVAALKPDACIHLAGIAFVPMGWSDPQTVMRVNLSGTLNVLEAMRAVHQAARVLIVTSAEVYGRESRPDPVREADPMTPSNLYGVSKMAADQAALLYQRHYDMPVMTARPQNHIGPRQSRLFVVSAFAEQLIALSKRLENDRVLRVGNLDSERDFTDVRDVARAYRLIIERGTPGEGYNIASGRMVPVRHMLDELCHHANVQPTIEIDPQLFRPTDRPPLLDIRKIADHTGWTPAIPLAQTLEDIYDDLAAHESR